MDLTVEEFVDGLLTEEALHEPSDKVKPEELTLELPEWFDEEKFNQGRRFYDDFRFAFGSSMLMGLAAVLAVPSILRVLVGTYRSSTVHTAYRRYASTYQHTVSWFEHELKPGSTSWKSLYAVRSRHLRAGLAGKLKGFGVVSQRDIALTQFGFIGFSVLKPDKYNIRQLKEGDWESYNHFWRVIGHMIGLQDRYNICRNTIDETRDVCRHLLDKVYTPCLDNVPEYYEHMARVLLEGMTLVIPSLNVDAALYYVRYLADVPGYVYTESDRISLQRRLQEQLKGKPLDTGVDSSSLTAKTTEILPERSPRLLYLRDYDTLETVPEYKRLSAIAKYRLNSALLYVSFYNTDYGRAFFNFMSSVQNFFMRYFPFMAFFKFGVLASYVNMFEESSVAKTGPKPNSEYYNRSEEAEKKPSTPWYLAWLPKELVELFNSFMRYNE